jgi:hypothetical protein
MSLANYREFGFVDDALDALALSSIMIGGSGNDGDGTGQADIGFPESHPSVITVSGTDRFDNLAFFPTTGTTAATGDSVDFSAPAIDIYTASWEDPADPMAAHVGPGTSFAAPMVVRDIISGADRTHVAIRVFSSGEPRNEVIYRASFAETIDVPALSRSGALALILGLTLAGLWALGAARRGCGSTPAASSAWNSAAASRARSFIRLYQGRLSEALEDARTAVELAAGGRSHAVALEVLGIVLYYRGETRAAIRELARALAETDPDADILYDIAIQNYATALGQGTDEEAARALELCADLRSRLKDRYKVLQNFDRKHLGEMIEACDLVRVVSVCEENRGNPGTVADCRIVNIVIIVHSIPSRYIIDVAIPIVVSPVPWDFSRINVKAAKELRMVDVDTGVDDCDDNIRRATSDVPCGSQIEIDVRGGFVIPLIPIHVMRVVGLIGDLS